MSARFEHEILIAIRKHCAACCTPGLDCSACPNGSILHSESWLSPREEAAQEAWQDEQMRKAEAAHDAMAERAFSEYMLAQGAAPAGATIATLDLADLPF